MTRAVVCVLVLVGTARVAAAGPVISAYGDGAASPVGVPEPWWIGVSNQGDAPLVITDAVLSGASTPAFQFDNLFDPSACGPGLDCPQTITLPPGYSYSYEVLWTPPAVGAFSTTLTLTSNAGPFSVTFDALGQASAQLAVSPRSLSFVLNQDQVSSGSALFSVTNTAAPPAADLVIHFSETSTGGPFTVDDSCEPDGCTISPGEERAFTLTVPSSYTGAWTGQVVVVPDDLSIAPQAIDLDVYAGMPHFTVDVAENGTVDLGTVVLGATATGSIGVHNDSPFTAEVVVSYFDDSPTVVTVDAPTWLYAGVSIDAATTCTPLDLTGFGESVEVMNEDTYETSHFFVACTPVAGAFTADDADFGFVGVGSTRTRTVTLHNATDFPVSLESIISSDPAFTIADTFPQAIAGGADLDVMVTFAPTAGGADSATLTAHAEHGDDLLVNVSGTGAGPIDTSGCGGHHGPGLYAPLGLVFFARRGRRRA